MTSQEIKQQIEDATSSEVDRKIWLAIGCYVPYYDSPENLVWVNIISTMYTQLCNPLRGCVESKLSDYDFTRN